MKDIHPRSGYQVAGYKYLGRGCGGPDWSRREKLFYRCAKCGDMMKASCEDYYNCQCKAMSLDIGAGRFGSQYGDQNILRYGELEPGEIDSLTSLQPGTTIEVLKEFRDFDGKLWSPGFQFIDFQKYSCVPYHGGHTFTFENAVLRLCDNEPDNNEVLFQSGQFFRIAT